MKLDDLIHGCPVRVIQLQHLEGVLVDPPLLQKRRLHVTGVAQAPLNSTDHVWWVLHDEDKTIAPYHFSELEALPYPPPKVPDAGWSQGPFDD